MIGAILYCVMITIVASIGMYTLFTWMTEDMWDHEVTNSMALIIFASILWPLTLLAVIFIGPVLLVAYLADKKRRNKKR